MPVSPHVSTCGNPGDADSGDQRSEVNPRRFPSVTARASLHALLHRGEGGAGVLGLHRLQRGPGDVHVLDGERDGHRRARGTPRLLEIVSVYLWFTVVCLLDAESGR